MRVLVTGADGFIGKHLTRHLKEQGHYVFVMDTKRDMSVLNTVALKNMMGNMDRVYHLAGVVGVQKTIDYPVKTFVVNALGTLLVAQIAKKTGAKMFLASSSEVYGQGAEIPLHEDMPIRCEIDKRWVYAMSKIAGEMMVQSVLPRDQYVIGRFFNVVGPGQHPPSGMVLPRFIDQAIQNRLITVHGTGSQERTFGYVTQIVKAVVALMQGGYCGTYNIAGTASCSIRQLAETVKDVLASDARIVYQYGPKGADRRLADTGKLKNALGWVPDMELKKIIQLTAGWWLNESSNHNAGSNRSR